MTGCGLPNNKSGGVDVHAYKAKSCPTTTTTATTTAQSTTTEQTTTTAAAAAAATSTPPSVENGVLGASKALSAPATAPAGVLGTLKTLGSTATSGTLPFTGLRLWIVELIALGLIGTGVAMRMLARRRA